jgi:hypothetical protein
MWTINVRANDGILSSVRLDENFIDTNLLTTR